MSRLKHVVWDWNGTLLDDLEAAIISINAMLEGRKLPVLDVEGYRKTFGFPIIDCYRKLGIAFTTDAEWDIVAKEFHAVYNRLADGLSLVPGTAEVLAGFAAAGVGMSVLSASELNTLRRFLRNHRIDHYFEHIFGHGDFYGSSKIELGCSLMERLKLHGSEVLLLGDTIHDFEVARAMGCRCVLYLDGHQDRQRLESCGCPLISGYSELEDCISELFDETAHIFHENGVRLAAQDHPVEIHQ